MSYDLQIILFIGVFFLLVSAIGHTIKYFAERPAKNQKMTEEILRKRYGSENPSPPEAA